MGPIRPATADAYVRLGQLIKIYQGNKTPGNYSAALDCFVEECGGTSRVCKDIGVHYGSINKARQTGGHKVDPLTQEAQIAAINKWVAPMLPAPSARAARL